MTRRSLFARLLAAAAVPFVGWKQTPDVFGQPPLAKLYPFFEQHEAISKAQFEMFKRGAMTPNECRAMLGFPPFNPNGDDLTCDPVST
jgi:hypothetical protein